jgi:REP element-mobilizing transposase RayT
MNRGARLQDIFYNDDSCAVFLELVGEAVERYEIRVHGYALMPNHFHLMVESVRGNLSDAMKLISSRYSQEINRRSRWDGSLFRGRFKNKIVYEDAHWLYLLAYLHLNPVRARFAATPSQYQWTSHDRYAGDTPMPEWLTTEEMASRLEGVGGYQKYLQAVMNGRRPVPDEFESVVYGTRGSQEHFIVKQEKAAAGISPEEALSQVSKLTGKSKRDILKCQRGRAGNAERVVALWWLIHGAGLSNVEASQILGITPAAVSKILAQIRDGYASYHGGQVADWITALKEEND